MHEQTRLNVWMDEGWKRICRPGYESRIFGARVKAKERLLNLNSVIRNEVEWIDRLVERKNAVAELFHK